MLNNEAAIEHIRFNNYTGIKAGLERDSFLEIWMVVVDGRIFARSWGFAERSWYHSFLQNSYGSIQCGAQVFHIKAEVPVFEHELNAKINRAYLAKYSATEHNRKYSEEIIKPAHIEKTMEFIVLES